MAEAALRGDIGTPEERAHRMEKAAIFMGQAAQTAEAMGKVIKDYRGAVMNEVAHGLGVARYPDGSVWYEGEWHYGDRHGLGVWRYTDGNIGYAGQWQNGLRHGLGVFRNRDGSVHYTGWWNKDAKSKTAPPECDDTCPSLEGVFASAELPMEVD
eukprot:GHVU01129620.1.p1 GENE.GHVU01129620.1~~GHVU01129620.1.p1  ORF type:complete len:164 (-),score=24.53 GHVU01129620.1:106-570(-)